MASTVKRAAFAIVGRQEDQPEVISVKEWVQDVAKNPKQKAADYLKNLFPIAGWITRYNFTWAISDLIAGLTVGMVLVPQSMSYATLATLPPEYGLYSSFVGVSVYCFFATSKDVSIGPVAVMSLTVSQIIAHVEAKHPKAWSAPEIATTVAFICGFIVLGIGLLRLGWIVEFISLPAVSGFMTGSAINIVAGQVPGLMGITGFNTRAATFHVIINTLKGLPHTTLDAAFGLVGLFFLYAIRIVCDALGRRFPRRARLFFFISVLRNAFVLLILTIAAWLFCRHRKDKKGNYPIKILKTVPSGFKHVGQPTIDPKLLSALGSELPVATIILLLEHIAIGKSFGRVNGYKINPNQELIAIGVTNTVGSCFGAYPATGSFSRTALKSKSGVRTPAAGLITAVVVIVALYGLTPAFYWIPTAGLSAVIIHAVADLVAKPKQVYSYWRVSPLEFLIWAAAVLVTVFSTIEDGIYTSIAASVALLLVRIARPRGNFLGRVKVHPGPQPSPDGRDVFIPLKLENGILNQNVHVEPPAPGVLVYRFEESFLFPNSSFNNAMIVDYVKANTRRGKDFGDVKAGDRPWNDPGPRAGEVEVGTEAHKPILRAIVLDFSGVSHLDTTATQVLIDTRYEVEKWADRPVEFHFATILSPWIVRALLAAGFGRGTPEGGVVLEVAQVGSNRDYADPLHDSQVLREERRLPDLELSPGYGGDIKGDRSGAASSFETLLPADTPFFHLDVSAAVRAAELGKATSRQTSRDYDAKS